MSVSDIIFALICFIAVGCMVAVITLQYKENDFYKNPLAPFGGRIWAPEVRPMGAPAPAAPPAPVAPAPEDSGL